MSIVSFAATILIPKTVIARGATNVLASKMSPFRHNGRFDSQNGHCAAHNEQFYSRNVHCAPCDGRFDSPNHHRNLALDNLGPKIAIALRAPQNFTLKTATARRTMENLALKIATTHGAMSVPTVEIIPARARNTGFYFTAAS